MPALLGPTNPVPGYDQQPVRVTVPQPGDTSIQNVVDPSRVTRPDQRSERQDQDDAANAQRYESNYSTFLQRLRETRKLPETFLRVLQWGTQVSSGIREGLAEELSGFMEFLRMDEQELLDLLRDQMQSGNRFSGALFTLLRDAYGQSRSDLLKDEILQFLRRYSDFSSTEHLEGKILRGTGEMAASMPSPWSQQAAEIFAKLQNGVEAGDRQGNLDLIRGQLFRLVARYVSTTHDHGRARQLLSMLSLDVARYENGDEEALARSFRGLASAGALPGELAQMSDEEILGLLRDMEFDRAAQNDEFAQRLTQVMDRALQGEGGPEAQEAFQNILAAMLTNESVFMPLEHLMLPIDWDGTKAFSEMWVDPDAERDRDGSGGGRTSRLLIKMDIQSLGAFDLVFETKGQEVSLRVGCPKSVAPYADQVAGELSGILTRDGLTPRDVSVSRMERPVQISEVFPKLFERMSGVNVRA